MPENYLSNALCIHTYYIKTYIFLKIALRKIALVDAPPIRKNLSFVVEKESLKKSSRI